MEREEKERIRVLYSIRDFQTALSAADFLLDCDESDKYSLTELRRFKCYETTLITSYARPFSASRGNFPKFSFEMIAMELNPEQEKQHLELIKLRDSVFAHSDRQMMRFRSTIIPIEFDSGETMHFPQFTWDEGLQIYGKRLRGTMDLIGAIIQKIASIHIRKMQADPEIYNLHLDYLHSSDSGESNS